MTTRTVSASLVVAFAIVVACTSSDGPGPDANPELGVNRAQVIERRTWERTPLPGRRSGALLAELHGKLYLLAASNNASQAMELWDFDGTSWRLLSPPVRPSQRLDASFVRLGDKLVLFGGRPPSFSSVPPLNETWEWDGSSWSQKSPATSPPPRYGHFMAEAQGKLVLFGGSVSPSSQLSDTWEWDGTTWTQRFPSTSPSARTYGSIGTVGSHAILFGGLDSTSNGVALGDTWRWDGNEWTRLTLSTSPSARYFQGSGTANGQAWVVGGRVRDYQASYLPDVWRFDGTAWVQVTAANGPSARISSGVGSLGGSLVVMGGTVRSSQDGYDRPDADVFLFNGTSWLEHPSSGPNFLSTPGAVSHQGRLTFYSPTNGWPRGEVWWTDGQSWGHVEPLNGPPAVKNSVMAIDPSTGHALLFGGQNPYGYLAETWEWNGTSWRKLSPATSPSARVGHAMAAFNGTVVLFGGQDGNFARLNDTWVWNGTTWTQLALTTRPSVRIHAGLAQAGNRLILFGGETGGTTVLGDTWAFDGTAWTQLTQIPSPPAMRDPAMTSLSGKALLFGGHMGSTPSNESDQTWEFDGTHWVHVSPTLSPPRRNGARLVSLGDRAILYGGSWNSGAISLDDVWTYRAIADDQATDSLPPTVVFTASGSGSTVTGTVTVTAAASDDFGVVTVDFLDGETLIGTAVSAPYSVSWNTRMGPNGLRTLTARARDAAGNVAATSPVTVTADNDLTVPGVSLTAPVPGARVSGTVVLSAGATDNRGVTRVEFHDGERLLGSDASSPFSYAWDTVAEVAGEHVLTARAYDAAGNEAASAQVGVTVWHDTQPPSVSITSLTHGASISRTVTIPVAATDEAGVTRVELFLDGALFGTDTSAPYSFSWNTQTVANGGYTLTARATDANGHVGTFTVGVTVDNTAPAVALTSPVSGAALSGIVSLQAEATDNEGVARVDFFVDGVLAASATAVPFHADWDSGSVVNGSHTLLARAHDAANNVTASTQVTVSTSQPGSAVYDSFLRVPKCATPDNVCDTTGLVKGRYSGESNSPNTLGGYCSDGPGSHQGGYEKINRIKLTSVTGERFAQGQRVRIEVHVTAPNPATDALDLFYTATATNDPRWTYLTTLLPGASGDQVLSTEYVLPVGTLQAVHAQFRVGGDKGPPCSTGQYDERDDVAFAVDSGPAVAITLPNNATRGGLVSLTATATDEHGVERVEFFVDGLRVGTDTSAPYEVRWDSTAVADGAHSLSAKAYDTGGLAGTSTVLVLNTDNTLPAVALTSPAPGGFLRGSVVLSATASDNRSVSRVEFYAGETLIGTDSSPPYSLLWNTEGMMDGAWTLTARAIDLTGNIGTSAGVGVTIDRTAPAAEISTPVQNAVVGGNVRLGATASDTGGVAKVELYADGTLIGTDTSAPYEAIWNSAFVGEGAHTLFAKAYDHAGNVHTSATVGVTVDHTPPATALDAPAQNALVRGTVAVSATASDSLGVERVEFYADGMLIDTDITAPYSVNWNTTTGANGGVTLTTRAYDLAGNVTVSAGRAVSVDNAAPSVAITSPANGATLFLNTTLQASASDNVGVTQVVFYDGGTVIGTDTTAPYSVSWSLLGVSKGTHTLTARAHDAAGNVTTSAPISVKVN
jgi:hypothetical protein